MKYRPRQNDPNITFGRHSKSLYNLQDIFVLLQKYLTCLTLRKSWNFSPNQSKFSPNLSGKSGDLWIVCFDWRKHKNSLINHIIWLFIFSLTEITGLMIKLSEIFILSTSYHTVIIFIQVIILLSSSSKGTCWPEEKKTYNVN